MAKDTISVTEFRANIYHLIDEVLEKGASLVVERNGKRARIIAEAPPKKRTSKKYRSIDNIVPLDIMTEPPEWYISPKIYEWSGDRDDALS